MEVNFYIWLVLTIVVTVYVGILIVRWQKKQDAKKTIPRKLNHHAHLFGHCRVSSNRELSKHHESLNPQKV